MSSPDTHTDEQAFRLFQDRCSRYLALFGLTDWSVSYVHAADNPDQREADVGYRYCSPRIRADFYYRAHSVLPLAPAIRPGLPRPLHPRRTQRRRRLRFHWTLRHRHAPYD